MFAQTCVLKQSVLIYNIANIVILFSVSFSWVKVDDWDVKHQKIEDMPDNHEASVPLGVMWAPTITKKYENKPKCADHPEL